MNGVRPSDCDMRTTIIFEPNRLPKRFTCERRIISPVEENGIATNMARMFSQLVPRLFAPSDEQLLWRVQQQDDAAAFGELTIRWDAPIRRLCERMTGDPHQAEDLAQEVFARTFLRRMEFKPEGKFSTFLWRVALNLCYDELRRRKHRAEFSLDALADDDSFSLPGDDPSPAARLEEQERGDAIRAALQRLSENYRAVVVLRHYEGLKFREIAEVLDIPEGTVKSRMTEALDQLAVLLKEFAPHVSSPETWSKQSTCV